MASGDKMGAVSVSKAAANVGFVGRRAGDGSGVILSDLLECVDALLDGVAGLEGLPRGAPSLLSLFESCTLIVGLELCRASSVRAASFVTWSPSMPLSSYKLASSKVILAWLVSQSVAAVVVAWSLGAFVAFHRMMCIGRVLSISMPILSTLDNVGARSLQVFESTVLN
jgi:hypothetical protein